MQIRKIGLVTVCAALGTAAHAQSSVILYGLADANVEYANHLSSVAPGQAGFPGKSGSRTGVTSGALAGSRWGLRGSEDLGGGSRALFVLESGFTMDDGKSTQGGRLFGRQGFLGLENDRLGALTLGRQYTSIFDTFANFTPTAYATMYEPVAVMTGLNFRSDNVVKYRAGFGGVNLRAHWTFGNGVNGAGEVPGQFRRDNGYGAGLNYAGQNVGAAIAYDQYNPTLSTGGLVGANKKTGGALSYAWTNVQVMGGYRWGQNKNNAGKTLFRDNFYWAGAVWTFQPVTLTLAYYYDQIMNQPQANAKNPWQVSFIAEYNFSKRTEIYLTSAYARNAGLNLDTANNSFSTGYALGKGENNMLGVALGVRHKF